MSLRTLCMRTLQPSRMPTNVKRHFSTLLRAKTRWVCSIAIMQRSSRRLRNRSAGAMSTVRNMSISQTPLLREQCVPRPKAQDAICFRPDYHMSTGHKPLSTPAPHSTFLILKELSILLGIRDSEKVSKERSYLLDAGSIIGLVPRPKGRIVLGLNLPLSQVFSLGIIFNPE